MHTALLRTDAHLCTQVLENLLSNAVKYLLPQKNIWLMSALVLPEEHTNKTAVPNEYSPNGSSHTALSARVRISVCNEGLGLSATGKVQLFVKFAHLSAKPIGGEHATRLGLSIVKRIIEMLEGNIWCENDYGHGATCIVELPAEFVNNTPQNGFNTLVANIEHQY